MATVNDPLGHKLDVVDATLTALGSDGRDISKGDVVAIALTTDGGKGMYKAEDTDVATVGAQPGSSVYAVALEDAPDEGNFRARLKGPVLMRVDGTANAVSAGEEIIASLGVGTDHWQGITVTGGTLTATGTKIIALAHAASSVSELIQVQFNGIEGFGTRVA